MTVESAAVDVSKPPAAGTKRKSRKSQPPKSLEIAAKPLSSPPNRPLVRPGLTGAKRTVMPLPAKSVEKAAKAFSNFSLSRFHKGKVPTNYVPHTHAKNPAAVFAVQNKSISTQRAALRANPPKSLGMTLALPSAKLAQLLPSLNEKKGAVDLRELLGVLKQNLQGAHFYASGNPTLNRVIQNASLLSQVQGYIQAIKTGTQANTAEPVSTVHSPSRHTQTKRVANPQLAVSVKKGGQ